MSDEQIFNCDGTILVTMLSNNDHNQFVIDQIKAMHSWHDLPLSTIVRHLPLSSMFAIATCFGVGEVTEAKAAYRTRMGYAESRHQTQVIDLYTRRIANSYDMAFLDNEYLYEEVAATMQYRQALKNKIMTLIVGKQD